MLQVKEEKQVEKDDDDEDDDDDDIDLFGSTDEEEVCDLWSHSNLMW